MKTLLIVGAIVLVTLVSPPIRASGSLQDNILFTSGTIAGVATLVDTSQNTGNVVMWIDSSKMPYCGSSFSNHLEFRDAWDVDHNGWRDEQYQYDYYNLGCSTGIIQWNGGAHYQCGGAQYSVIGANAYYDVIGVTTYDWNRFNSFGMPMDYPNYNVWRDFSCAQTSPLEHLLPDLMSGVST